MPTRENPEARKLPGIFFTLGERFILGGDYNAKNTQWGSRLTTTDRNKILDVIDFYISKKVPMHYMKVEDSYNLDSDHSPIIMTLSDKIIKKEANPTLTNKFTDWESFEPELNEKIQLNVPLRTTQQLDIETERIVDLIQEAAWNNTPQIKKKGNRK